MKSEMTVRAWLVRHGETLDDASTAIAVTVLDHWTGSKPGQATEYPTILLGKVLPHGRLNLRVARKPSPVRAPVERAVAEPDGEGLF